VAAPAPVAPRAPEPVAAAPPPPLPKRTQDPAPPKVASRPEPAAPAADRSAPPKLLSARTDPGTSIPTGGMRVIPLVPVGPATGARGQLLWEPIGGGTLVVSGLPQPPAGRTYQLWLGSINLGNRVSAGLLAVDSQGTGTLRVAPPRATWSADIFGITMERQGGAREPSDDLVLVGELSKLTPGAPPPASTAAATTSPPTPERGAAGSAPSSSDTPLGAVTTPAVTASIPPAAAPTTRGADGQLVRVYPASVERTWTVAQSVLRSLGWDIDQANQGTGVIRTEPRNVTFKDFVLYAEGTRHTLDVVVRPVSGNETSISVRRQVFEEQRIFWTKERKVLATPESSVEQTVLDAISRLL
jgi:hypothetical protein